MRTRLWHDGYTESEIARLWLTLRRLQERTEAETATVTEVVTEGGGEPPECPELDMEVATSGWFAVRFVVPWHDEPPPTESGYECITGFAFPQWAMVTDCYIVVEMSLIGEYESGFLSVGEPSTVLLPNTRAYSGFVTLKNIPGGFGTDRMYHWYRGNYPNPTGQHSLGVPRGDLTGDTFPRAVSLWYGTNSPPSSGWAPVVHVLLKYVHLSENPWYDGPQGFFVESP